VLGKRDFIGFYDWLRTDGGRVVGVQFILAEDWPDLVPTLQGLQGVQQLTSHAFRIFYAKMNEY